MPHLDRAAGWGNPEIAGDAGRLPCAPIDDREKQRVVAQAIRAHPGAIARQSAERAVGEIGPTPPLLIRRIGSEQSRRMAVGIERLQPTKPALHRLARRTGWRCPARQRETDRLAKIIEQRFHYFFSTRSHTSLMVTAMATILALDLGKFKTVAC